MAKELFNANLGAQKSQKSTYLNHDPPANLVLEPQNMAKLRFTDHNHIMRDQVPTPHNIQ
jgi:hypothetical protein